MGQGENKIKEDEVAVSLWDSCIQLQIAQGVKKGTVERCYL